MVKSIFHSPTMLCSAFTLVALVGYASAQLKLVLTMDSTSHFSWYIIDDSQRANKFSTCENAVAGIVGNLDAAKCVGAASFVGVAAAASSSSSSLVPSLSSWFTNICNSPKCSNDTIAAVVKNITTGCASELNLTNSSISTLVSTVEQLYPAVRQIICLME